MIIGLVHSIEVSADRRLGIDYGFLKHESPPTGDDSTLAQVKPQEIQVPAAVYTLKPEAVSYEYNRGNRKGQSKK